MSYLKYLWVALAMGLVAVTAAPAEDLSCVINALAFDDNLNPLPVQGVSVGAVPSRNPAKACGRNKVIGIDAAQAACRDNQDARFVALFRRIEGVDLVKSKDSKAKFNEKNPMKEEATIKMKSCAYWLAPTQ